MVTQQKTKYTNVSLWVENDSIHSETFWTILGMYVEWMYLGGIRNNKLQN